MSELPPSGEEPLVLTLSDEELKLFFAESREQLAELERILLSLESAAPLSSSSSSPAAAGEPDDRAVVDRLFRAAHTLKGNAALAGFRAVANLTHAMESVFAAVRDGRATLRGNRYLIDLLLRTVDVVNRLLSPSANGAVNGSREENGPMPLPGEAAPAAVVTQLLDQLDAAVATPPGTAPASPAAAASDAAPGASRAAAIPAATLTPDQGGTVTADHASPSSNLIRVDVHVLDTLMDLVGELVIDRNRLALLASRGAPGEQAVHELPQLASHLSRLTGELQTAVMQLRMVPVETLFRKLPRLVRETARVTGKEVRLEMSGGETELDRSLVEALHEPVLHLIRNAIDHGIEDAGARQRAGKPPAGLISLRAYHREGSFYLEVSDDGRGIDPEAIRQAAVVKGELSPEAAARLSDHEAIQLLFRPGFSTRQEVTEISGRGVGLDVVRQTVERLNGSLDVESTPGVGTTFRLRLPLTLAIIRSLLVEAAGVAVAIPLAYVVEAVRADRERLATVRGKPVLRHRDHVLPVVRLRDWWAGSWGRPVDGERATTAAGLPAAAEAGLPAVIVRGGRQEVALLVDALLVEEEVVIKPLGRFLGDLPGLAGTALLGDGRIALILDVPAYLAKHVAPLPVR